MQKRERIPPCLETGEHVQREAKYGFVLFDMDGVLLDSRANMQAAWSEVQQALGIAVPFEQYFALIGMPFADIMTKLGLASQSESARSIYFSATRRHAGLLRWFPGAEETLRRLSSLNIKLGIVTSKEASRTHELLRELPVTFHNVQCPQAGYRGKPAPDHILLACAQCNVDPVETIFIGDMKVDCEAARRAGVSYCHAAWGYGSPPQSGTPVLFHSMQLLNLVTMQEAA